MNRKDLRQLAQLRVREASSLMRARCPSGAYYLAGYAVECALKACIARKTRRFEFPDRELARKVWTHDLESLVELAGLQQDHRSLLRRSQQFRDHWSVVKDWSADCRYRVWRMADARELMRAVTAPQDGVMVWVSKYW